MNIRKNGRKTIVTITITALFSLLCSTTLTTTSAPVVVEAFIISNPFSTQRRQHHQRPQSVDRLSSSSSSCTNYHAIKITERTTRGTSSVSLSSTASDDDNNNNNDNNNDDNILSKFDLPNAAFLIGGQSTLILISALLSIPLSAPNYGLGSNFALSPSAIATGVLATTPLIAIAFLLDLVEDKIPALRDTTMATYKSVLVVLGSQRRPLIAFGAACALGLAAGFGEEMLFRGVLQNWLMQATENNVLVSVGVSSVLFGLLHLATPLYAVIAMLASSYFGWLFLGVGMGSNLAVPVVCHGLYDVWALCWAHYVITGMTREEQLEVWNWNGSGSLSSYGGDKDDDDDNEKKGVGVVDNKTIL